MKRQYALSFVASVSAIVCYLAFALLAFTRFPVAFSPVGNWLSDLGSVDLNPRGALFYNIGIVATGAALALFFLGLSRWKTGDNRLQNIMMYVTQGLGILGAFSLVMSGFFPINVASLHSFFSIAFYILLGTAFAFSIAALRYHPHYPRWLLVLGALVAVADIFSGIFHTVFLLEWITVALFLCYIGLVGAETNRLSSGALDRSIPVSD